MDVRRRFCGQEKRLPSNFNRPRRRSYEESEMDGESEDTALYEQLCRQQDMSTLAGFSIASISHSISESGKL